MVVWLPFDKTKMLFDEIKYSELLKQNRELAKQTYRSEMKVLVLANVMVHYLKEYLEYYLRTEGINPQIKFGDYDNIVQASADAPHYDAVVVFWEPINFIDGYQYKSENMSEQENADLLARIKMEMNLTLANLSQCSFVVFNRFQSSIFNPFKLRSSHADLLVAELNTYLQTQKPTSVQLFDLGRIFEAAGIPQLLNKRDYYSSKVLYTTLFFKYYSHLLLPFFRSVKGKSRKALIFDCDNTLWKGILGEDGISGISMTSLSKEGIPFAEVQSLAKSLAASGVIIGLCSKNNPEDVDQVIASHPDMVLKEEDIVIKKVNWNDKVSNLRSIATDLNIGIDSLVFVDDSDFEINLIRSELPEVKTFQVPKEIHKYPDLIREISNLFFQVSQTKEDLQKTKNYKEQILRNQELEAHGNIEDYLKSLQLELDIYLNSEDLIPRLAQMTQKTNQFNLTTKRLSEQDIANLIATGAKVYAFGVKDKFGDSGITGMAIIIQDGNRADFHSLLLSCRVLGRNLEFAFIYSLIRDMKEQGMEWVDGHFIRTPKNAQVENLYETLGFEPIIKENDKRDYSAQLRGFTFKTYDYIKINRHE
jgi:FkbH-like protein